MVEVGGAEVRIARDDAELLRTDEAGGDDGDDKGGDEEADDLPEERPVVGPEFSEGFARAFDDFHNIYAIWSR